MKIGDLMQKFFMSNPKRAKWFISTMPASFWEKQGRKKALATFHEAATKVPAYREFLNDSKINPNYVKDYNDFQKIPFTDKKKYLLKSNLKDLCLDGSLRGMYVICRSSGSSGKALYWPRVPKQDEFLPYGLEQMYRLYKIDKKKTLFLVTFALGTWVAADITSSGTKAVAALNRYPLSVMTPGSNIGEIIEIIKDIGSEFDQIILAGYPPTVKNIIDYGDEEGLDWRNLDVKLMIGGEAFTEEWRNYIAERLGQKDLMGVISVFGTGEGGYLGFETPIAVLIKKLLVSDQELCQTLFGMNNINTLIQYNPLQRFIEEQNKELVMTCGGGLPLIRYNIHDIGGIITFDRLINKLSAIGIDVIDEVKKTAYSHSIWKWPFFYAVGRSDSISIGGANIYAHDLFPVIHSKENTELNSFKIASYIDKNLNANLTILIEVKPHLDLDQSIIKKLKKKYYHLFLNQLLEVNRDFRDAYRIDQRSLQPKIKVFPYADGPFEPDHTRNKEIYIISS